MNDRLKFRVFNLETKTMIDNPDFLSFDYDCDFVRIRDPKLSINEIFNLKYDKIIIDQCTGLKDKNGKLIFENDVIKSRTKDMNCIVKYDNVNCAFNISKAFIEINQAEVIGNIHQDSHLLGGK